MESILGYIIAAILLLFGGREVFNHFTKKNLKKKLNETQNELDAKEIQNEKEKLDIERDNYRKLLDEYRNSKSKREEDSDV